MIEEHRVTLRDRVVAQPAILEWEIWSHVREMQRVAKLVEERRPVGLTAVRTQNEIDLVGDANRRAERPRALPRPVIRIVEDATAGDRIDTELPDLPPDLP